MPLTRTFHKLLINTEIRALRRDAEDDGQVVLEGLAARTGVRYQVWDFEEIIAPGAFERVLEKDGTDVVALVNHDYSQVLGREANETLELSESKDGLEARITLNGDTTLGRDVAAQVERGDLHQMSFGFWITRNGQEWSEDGQLRTITEIDELDDVSVVTRPANPETSISVARDLELDDISRELRSACRAGVDDVATRQAMEREELELLGFRHGLTLPGSSR